MTPWQTMRRAILPQAARVALPPLSNSFISLVKDTSLAATIQVPELFRQAQWITSRTLEVFTMYLAASLIYWIMATVLSTLQNHFENQLCLLYTSNAVVLLVVLVAEKRSALDNAVLAVWKVVSALFSVP